MTLRAAIAIVVCLGLSAAAPAFSQPIVRLVIPAGGVYVDEPVALTIEVEGFGECDAPVVPAIDGCTVGPIVQSGESSYTSIVGGRVTRRVTRTYRFELTPHRAGPIHIPPVAVRVDGRVLETEAATLRVAPSDAAELISAELTCARPRLYVGQRAHVTLRLWIRPPQAGRYVLNERETARYLDASSLGPFAEDFRSARPEGADDGRYLYESSADVVPRSPGALEVEGLAVAIDYPTAFERDIFGGIAPARVRRLRASPRTSVEVLPLPTEGRPPNFSGAVGRFEIDVRASATNVRVGDPIELTIDITGDGVIETLGPPLLAADERLNADFRVPAEELAGQIVGTRKRFTQVLRAKRPDVSQIPPIEYAYFDPYAERYAVARSRPIPIRVAPAETLSAADLDPIAPPPQPPANRVEPLTGLYGFELDESELLAVHRPVQPWHLAAATLAPPAIFMLVWAPARYVRARHADPAGRRRRTAWSTAVRRIDRARGAPEIERAREIRAALIGYLADRTRQPAARLDAQAAVRLLEDGGVRPDVVDAWRRTIERCEQAAFGGPAAGTLSDLPEAARDCLARLERERL